MSGILTFTKLISLMEKSDKNKKLFKEIGREGLLNIFKESAIVKKKMNAKDTPENRTKFQKIMLKGIARKRKRPKKEKKAKESKCSAAGKSLSKTQSSSAGKILSQCGGGSSSSSTTTKSKEKVKVPDKAKGAIPQKEKNKTAYGKEADKAEPDKVAKASLKRDWTIVSDNCYGVAYMKALNKPYESPFFSMFIYAPDYLTLLENFDEYMKLTPVSQLDQPTSQTDKFGGKSKYRKVISKYPVLLLKGSKGDVEIHFAHEKQSPQEAIRKWTSRTKRMNMNKNDMFVKMDSRDKFTVELGKRFLALKQFPHKRLFVSEKYKSSLGGMKDVVVMDYKTQTPIGTKTEKLFPVPSR